MEKGPHVGSGPYPPGLPLHARVKRARVPRWSNRPA